MMTWISTITAASIVVACAFAGGNTVAAQADLYDRVTHGYAVSEGFAMSLPQMTENLIILNLPHPNGFLRELRSNKDQIANSECARNFQTKSPSDPTVFFGKPMTPETLSSWVRDPAARKRYVEAFQRSVTTTMRSWLTARTTK